MLPGSPIVLEDYTFLVNHAIADVSGDEYPEIITGTGGYFLHAVDGCGREAPGFPKFTNGWIASTAAVGDIDGDALKSLEVVVGTRAGYLFAWTTKGKASGPVEWESFHHDNANTGNVATKLEQGVKGRAATPLECPAVAPAAPPSTLDPSGGCACDAVGSAGSRSGPSSGGLALGLAAFALTWQRRSASRARPRHRCTSRRRRSAGSSTGR